MRREKKKHYDWHHRKPRSLGGNSADKNMSHVSVSKHRAWHTLFGNYTPEQIIRIINNTWLDPDYELIAKRKE